MKYTFYLFVFLIFTSCSWFKNYPQDNVIEELVEDFIEEETGQHIDLSPFSPEQKMHLLFPVSIPNRDVI